MKTRDSSVGISTGYGLDDRMIGFRFPAGAVNFSHRRRVQTGSGAHPVGIGAVSLEVKRKGMKLTTHLHLLPRSKNAWSYASTPAIRFHNVVLS
jgi:hypothetical protein